MNESISIKDLAEKLDRLRADLAATNQALAAATTVLTPAQHRAMLEAMAAASAQKQQLYERAPTPAAKAAIRLFQEAEARLYQHLQAAPQAFGPAQGR